MTDRGDGVAAGAGVLRRQSWDKSRGCYREFTCLFCVWGYAPGRRKSTGAPRGSVNPLVSRGDYASRSFVMPRRPGGRHPRGVDRRRRTAVERREESRGTAIPRTGRTRRRRQRPADTSEERHQPRQRWQSGTVKFSGQLPYCARHMRDMSPRIRGDWI
jgi:hypothetical protein